MEKFDVLISYDELKNMLESDRMITQNDRFRIDSYTHKTLITDLGSGFSHDELQEVYLLESNNLKRILLLTSGYFEDDVRVQISQMPFLVELMKELRKMYKGAENQEANFFTLYIKYCLSGFSPDLKVKFEGTIPKKFLSGRQLIAEDWFKEYTDFILLVARKLYSRNKELARSYIYANTAYYLNKSQPSKYIRRQNETMNDALYRILIAFMGSNFKGDRPSITSGLYFKDL